MQVLAANISPHADWSWVPGSVKDLASGAMGTGLIVCVIVFCCAVGYWVFRRVQGRALAVGPKRAFSAVLASTLIISLPAGFAWALGHTGTPAWQTQAGSASVSFPQAAASGIKGAFGHVVSGAKKTVTAVRKTGNWIGRKARWVGGKIGDGWNRLTSKLGFGRAPRRTSSARTLRKARAPAPRRVAGKSGRR